MDNVTRIKVRRRDAEQAPASAGRHALPENDPKAHVRNVIARHETEYQPRHRGVPTEDTA